jgi:hypothetical protein
MYVLVRYPVGVVIEGVVLAQRRNSLRIAAAGFGDTLELKRSGDHWIDSSRDRVELEFLMSNFCQAELATPTQKVQFARAN